MNYDEQIKRHDRTLARHWRRHAWTVMRYSRRDAAVFLCIGFWLGFLLACGLIYLGK